MSEKPTNPLNPKDAIAASKLPLHLAPDTVPIYASVAFAEGALKYGAYNWRAAGVRFSVYIAAMLRHVFKLWNGEWADPKTKVPHIASIIACCGIIADAKLVGKLTDDRPPVAPVTPLIEELEGVFDHLKVIFSDKDPHHWTIEDQIPND